jgi:hypothetical protein
VTHAADGQELVSGVRAVVPNGWQVAEHWQLAADDPDVLIHVDLRPAGSDVILGNLVSQDGAALNAELDDYAEATLEWFGVLGAHAGVLRDFTWATENGRRRELRLYTLGQGRRLLVRASAPDDSFPRYRLTFLDFLTQLALAPARPDPAVPHDPGSQAEPAAQPGEADR